MNGEYEFVGVFFPTALVAGIVALAFTLVGRRALRAADAYTYIWHAGLFDVALFVLSWAVVNYLLLSKALSVGGA